VFKEDVEDSNFKELFLNDEIAPLMTKCVGVSNFCVISTLYSLEFHTMFLFLSS
jgi:hypothetical protein